MRIAVDFDGTICKHAYPLIGEPIPGATRWLRKWIQAGAILILWTVRSDKALQDALDYCLEQGVLFESINSGLSGDENWTNSPKVYAALYIDDAAFGCPLIVPECERPYVDWSIVGPAVLERIKDWKKVA